MTICASHDFREGLVFALEKAGLYDELLRYYVRCGDFEAVFQACRRFAVVNAKLWIAAVRLLAAAAASESKVRPVLHEMLVYLHDSRVSSPVQIMEIVAQSAPDAPLALIADYVAYVFETGANAAQEVHWPTLLYYRSSHDGLI